MSIGRAMSDSSKPKLRQVGNVQDRWNQKKRLARYSAMLNKCPLSAELAFMEKSTQSSRPSDKDFAPASWNLLPHDVSGRDVLPLLKRFHIRDGVDLFGWDVPLRVDAIEIALHSVVINAEEPPDDDGAKQVVNKPYQRVLRNAGPWKIARDEVCAMISQCVIWESRHCSDRVKKLSARTRK